MTRSSPRTACGTPSAAREDETKPRVARITIDLSVEVSKYDAPLDARQSGTARDVRILLREPLVYFVVLSALLFVGAAFLSKGNRPETLVVTKARVAELTATFEQTWQRPPTGAELQELIDGYIRDEVSVREAIALGLDTDDTIIRRRLRQKMEIIAQDEAAQTDPTEDELRRYFESHAGDYRTEGGLPSFEAARDRVHLDWADAERRAARDRYYHALLARYTIVRSTEE